MINLLDVLRKYSPDQPRDEAGRWTDGGARTEPTLGEWPKSSYRFTEQIDALQRVRTVPDTRPHGEAAAAIATDIRARLGPPRPFAEGTPRWQQVVSPDEARDFVSATAQAMGSFSTGYFVTPAMYGPAMHKWDGVISVPEAIDTGLRHFLAGGRELDDVQSFHTVVHELEHGCSRAVAGQPEQYKGEQAVFFEEGLVELRSREIASQVLAAEGRFYPEDRSYNVEVRNLQRLETEEPGILDRLWAAESSLARIGIVDTAIRARAERGRSMAVNRFKLNYPRWSDTLPADSRIVTRGVTREFYDGLHKLSHAIVAADAQQPYSEMIEAAGRVLWA